tara:strand:+ start:290 stop:718 length:429 start_codon:yes stop_codon:yes gene_type:complete
MVSVGQAAATLDLVVQKVPEEAVMLVLVVHLVAVVVALMAFIFKILFQERISLLPVAVVVAAAEVGIEMPLVAPMLVLFSLFLVDYLDLMVQVMVVTEAALMEAAEAVLVMVIVVELVEPQELIILRQHHQIHQHHRELTHR